MSRYQSPRAKFGSKAMPKPVDHNQLQYVPPPTIASTNFMPVEVNTISLTPRSPPTSAWPDVDEAGVGPYIGPDVSKVGVGPRDVVLGASKFAQTSTQADDVTPNEICIHPTGMDRLTCGEKNATVVFYLVTGIVILAVFADFWLFLHRSRKAKKNKRRGCVEDGIQQTLQKDTGRITPPLKGQNYG